MQVIQKSGCHSSLYVVTRERHSVAEVLFRNPSPVMVQSIIGMSHWQVSIILAITPIRAPFSKAAATRSLSANCLLTSSPVLCVPSLIRTSIRNREGRDCSRRTRTPNPMTVAKLQCVMVGVMSTVTVCRGDSGTFGRVGLIEISGRETTANSPSEMGCSGSEMDEMRSDSDE